MGEGLKPEARLFFVVNEHAGNGKARRIFQRVRPLLTEADEAGITQRAGDGQRIAAEAARAGNRLVVAVGGDGTINETVNGLAEAGFQAVLGILPAGGANDLAYTLGLPSQPEQAMAVLRRGRTRPLDLGRVTFDGGHRERYYANVLGMGLSGAIAAAAQTDKRFGGSFTYLALLLLRMFRARPSRFELSLEEEPLFQRALAAHMANGRREGRLFSVAPSARVDDGLLDLVAVEDVALVARPWFALQVLRGHLLEQRGIYHRRVSAATIRAIEPLPYHMDGEPFLLAAGQTARVEVRPGALLVVAPEAA